MPTKSAVLTIDDLRKRYSRTAALNGVNLRVLAGEVFGLIGPNGSGKTTTVECALGLRHADHGKIKINGLDPLLHQRDLARTLGVVFQEGGIDDSLKLTHYFGFRTSYSENPMDEDEVWANFGLLPKKHARFGALSGGEKQRVMIATTLAARPTLAIMDEPTSGLDPQARYDFWRSVRMTITDATSVLVTTHNLSEAQDNCDRLAIMNKGRVLCANTAAGLLDEHKMNIVARLRIKSSTDTGPLEEKLCRIKTVTRTVRRFDAVMVHMESMQERDAVERTVREHDYDLSDLVVRPGILDDLFFFLIREDNKQ